MIPIIGLASGLGAGHEGCRHGPVTIQQKCNLMAEWKKIIHHEQDVQYKREHISRLNQELAQAVHEVAAENPFTLVVGGDHSCAIGTWSGIAEAYRTRGEDVGLIWFDAHMDSHCFETSESGNVHGMPLAALLGHGSPEYTQILSECPKIKPENLFLVGIRSFEPPEKERLEQLNVRIYYMEEILDRGLEEVFSEIHSNLSMRKIPYGISVDIDAFDPKWMSATGTPVDNGLDPEEFIALYSLVEDNPPVAFEFVEFNPLHDTNDDSLQLIQKMLQKVIEVESLSKRKASATMV